MTCPRWMLRPLARRSPRWLARLYLEQLEPRDAPTANTVLFGPQLPRAPLPNNIESNLATLYLLDQADDTGTAGGMFVPAASEQSKASLRNLLQDLLQVDAESRVVVAIWTRGPTAPTKEQLGTRGIEIHGSSEAYHLIEASLNLRDLPALAALPTVLSVTPAYRPLTRAGSVQTQGDAVVNGPAVRAAGFDGAPFLIGALSDSALYLAAGQASADLPAVVDRYLEFPASEEGRALLEIVHDVAPGASLAHHSAILSELSFADGIRKLAAADSRVIVDDVWYFAEPFFQDGIIAQAVDEVTATGVLYVSAAGNDAARSYEAAFAGAGAFHDFDPSAAVDTRQQITVAPGKDIALVFQWDDPFYTTSGVTHDFDIRVYSGSTVVASGTTNNLSTQQPLEVLRWVSRGTGVYEVEIERRSGSGASQLKYVLSTNADTGSIDEYATNSGTVVGHPAAAGAVAVGAVPYYAPSTIEPFSSRGNTTIYFAPNGDRLASPVVRQKPDVVAPDNVNTTFFGRDIPEDADTLPNFAGTSAAAPHVAGVAALVLDVNPHLTRGELYHVLTSSAVDLGTPGRDPVFGFGRIDAEAARLAAQAVPDVTAPTAQLVSPIAVHSWPTGQLKILFSEPLNAADAVIAANYTLVGAGADGTFGTGDDITYTVSPAYSANARTSTLTVTAPVPVLGDGLHRLTLRAVGGLTDEAGNSLQGGTNQVLSFTMASRGQSVATEPATALDLRPDGTAVLAYPNNPQLGRYKWPQVMVGQVEAGGRSTGPFRSIPTDIEDSFQVEHVDVAVNASGGVLVYSDYVEIIRGAPDLFNVTFQRIDAGGRAVGPRNVVAGIYANSDRRPRVAMNAAGSFVLVFPDLAWNGTAYQAWVKALRLNAVGEPLGEVFTVSQQPGGTNSVVALAGDGSSVFVWEREGQILARRYIASGAALGSEFQVFPTLSLSKPAIGIAADGSFVIAAQGGGIHVQRFTPAGVPLGQPVQVTPNGLDPQIDVAADGRFVLAWRAPDRGDDGIYAQRFAADGTFVGTRIWVNGAAPGNQSGPQVGILDSGNFVVSWQEPNGTGRLRYYSWNAPDEATSSGPWVRSLSTSQPTAGPISSVTVTFDRVINRDTFTAADVTLTDPVGRGVTVTEITTSDNRTFTISFPAQQLAGRYRVQVGPDVRDGADNLMDQNGNVVNGEAGDAFVSYVQRSFSATGVFPFNETFESGSVDALGGFWSFAVASNISGASPGRIELSSASAPHGSAYHLRMFNTAVNVHTQREAVLRLDLSVQALTTNLALDFWLKNFGRNVSDNYVRLYVSGDDITYRQVGGDLDPGVLGQYAHFSFDLDQVLTAAGVVPDADVYLKFLHHGFYSDSAFTIDDIRISNLDVFGPRILAQNPAALIAPPIRSFTVTFSEPINPATFTMTDVSVMNPLGAPVTLADNPVSSSDNQTFRIEFAADQPLAGSYRFTIGPDVHDLAGNPMNQNGDAVLAGPSDRYTGVLQVGALAGVALPYTQGFEVGNLTPLASNWRFAATAGIIELTTSDGPHGGAYHLRMSNGVFTPASNRQTQREAVLRLDLSAHTGATNLALDFWLKRTGRDVSDNYARLYVSGDGSNFTGVGGDLIPGAFNQYLHYAFDFDQLLVSASLAQAKDVYLKFWHNAFYSDGVMTFDDIRVSTGDVFGPHIVSQTPMDPVPGPVSSIMVTFNKAIDSASFTEDDVQVIAPDGAAVQLAGNPTASADQRTFTVTFAVPQTLAGIYRVSVGPRVSDLAGNFMDQNQDRINASPGDVYAGNLVIGPTVARALPYTQGFESATLQGLDGWSFAVTSGRIQVTTSDGPHGGAYHLRMSNGVFTPASNRQTQREAVLRLDLSAHTGATNLALDFWLKRTGRDVSDNYARLYASGDGTTFTRVGGDLIPGAFNQYLHYAFDLDQLLASTGLAQAKDVYLKFWHNAFYSDGVMTFDDIRVRAGDHAGPRVLSHTPTGQVAGPASELSVTFNEDINAASFTAADVTLVGPSGLLVPLDGDPLDSGDHRTFTIKLAAGQTLRGLYTLRIGPDVFDLAGNEMNQDQDLILGERNEDTYVGPFQIGPSVAQTLPYVQGFETTDLGSLGGWSFAVPNSGVIELTSADGPYLGAAHLRMSNGVFTPPFNRQTQREAVLRLDLSAHTGATNLALDFWLKKAGRNVADHFVTLWVSNDDITYKQVGSKLEPPFGVYTHYVYDLDQTLAAASVVLDADVYLKFQHSGFYSDSIVVFDQVRVQAGTLNNPPRLNTVTPLTGGIEDQAYTITHDALAAAADETDPNGDPVSFRIQAVSTGVLTKNGQPVVPATTLLSAGESLVWTPAANANGTLNAFTIRAWDGDLASTADVQVKVAVTPVNDAPSFTLGLNQTVLEDAGLQTVANWATNLLAGPLDEAGQTLTFVVTDNSKRDLFSTQPTITRSGTSATLTYRPAPNANGIAVITVVLKDSGETANGGQDTSAQQYFSITITPVNDQPSFTKGPNQTVLEDAGPQTVANWAKDISAGPPDEAAVQTLTFQVTSNNPALFTQLAISSSGELTYRPARDANGSATITVVLKDSGGTANGGQEMSAQQTFTITITPVNDPPSFTRQVNPTVLEDAGLQTIANWATFYPGAANETSQRPLAYTVTSVSNSALFEIQPRVANNGTLSFKPAANANGTATFTLKVQDDGGTANNGQDTSLAQMISITVTPVNDPPSFTKGPPWQNLTVRRNVGSQWVPNWATNLSAGPTADEAGQRLEFEVANDFPALFVIPPTISVTGNTGTLQYSPNASINFVGTANVKVRLKDNGGTANGGFDTSFPDQTFTITITSGTGAHDPDMPGDPELGSDAEHLTVPLKDTETAKVDILFAAEDAALRSGALSLVRHGVGGQNATNYPQPPAENGPASAWEDSFFLRYSDMPRDSKDWNESNDPQRRLPRMLSRVEYLLPSDILYQDAERWLRF